MVSPAVTVPPIVADTLPLSVVPNVTVSVAPLLVELEYVGELAIVTTAADEEALIPIAAKFVSAFIALASPAAMLLSVEDDGTE